MSTAGYLQDAKNQQKRLAEIITAKGITATATEKYKSLVDKVAQIEELKGEEKVLENFTNILDKPKSIVQLEYPNDTPKTLNAKLGSKNLIPPIGDTPYYSGNITGGKPYVPSNTNTISSLTNINVSAFRGVYTVKKLEEGKTYTLSLNGLVNNCATKALFLTVGFRSSEDTVFGTTDTSSYKSSGSNATSLTFTVPSGKPYCLIGFYNYPTTTGDTISLNAMQLELGTVATDYTPYISDFSTINVTRYGKNFFDKDIAYADYDNVGGGYKGLNYYVGIGTTVTISLTETPTTGKGYMYVRPTISPGAGTQSWLAHSTVEALCIKQQTVVSTDGYISICMSTEAYNTFVEKIQIELGSAATEYEPYQGQTYTPTATGEVTGITNLYPLTNLLTDNTGVLFTEVTGGVYKEILPSEGKNGITKIWQPAVEETAVCDYSYDETTKTLTLLL